MLDLGQHYHASRVSLCLSSISCLCEVGLTGPAADGLASVTTVICAC